LQRKTKADDTNATTKTVIKIITRHSRDINIRDKRDMKAKTQELSELYLGFAFTR
jgi:hypothetical protein